MRDLACALLAALVAAATGCTSSRHFPDQAHEAEHAILRAEQSGAKSRARPQLAAARESLDYAANAEELASRDRRTANDTLSQSRHRLQRASAKLDDRRQRLADEEERRRGLDKRLEELNAHAEELRGKGLSDTEIDRLVQPEIGLAKVRQRESEAMIGTLKGEIELAELEKKDAELAQQAAEARLETAEKRLAVAQALYKRAEEQARLAQAESDASHERDLRSSFTEM